ncbi:MAG TPA: hypothetical protein VFV87_04910, partial [Pirellulaceae bacterium]|nr:hypothetical protein [Pirellulaceae bacterium]
FPGPDLFSRLRQRPCAPLLTMMWRRLEKFDAARLARRGQRGRELAGRLAPHYETPGSAAAEHSYWVMPVLADDPPATIARLARAGFHATQGRSLCVVPAPADSPQHLQPIRAKQLLRQAVFLPVYPEVPGDELDRLANVLTMQSALEVEPKRPLATPASGWPNRRVAFWPDRK